MQVRVLHGVPIQGINMQELKIGFTACYINDFKADHITDLPFDSALTWAKEFAGDVHGGCGRKSTFNTFTEANDWMNKLFVVVGYEHGKWVALYNHDGTFSVRTITPQ